MPSSWVSGKSKSSFLRAPACPLLPCQLAVVCRAGDRPTEVEVELPRRGAAFDSVVSLVTARPVVAIVGAAYVARRRNGDGHCDQATVGIDGRAKSAAVGHTKRHWPRKIGDQQCS